MKNWHTRKNTATPKWLLIALALVSLTTLADARKSHFNLRQEQEAETEEEVYDTVTERNFDYLNAFLAGFRSNQVLPSFSNCSKFLEQSILLYNDTMQNWQDEEYTENMTRNDYVFNSTHWISYELAPASRYCVSTGLETYLWGLNKALLFESFGDIFQGWLQNLLGNVITFNSLYKKIEEAEEADNMKEIYYWYGRFTILFIDFEPVEKDTDPDFDIDQEFFSEIDAELFGGTQSLMRTSKVNSFEKQPRVRGTFQNSYALVSGFLNASIGQTSPDANICTTNISRIIEYSQLFGEQVTNGTGEVMLQAAVSFENILGSVDPIAFSCYRSFFEFGDTGEQYSSTVTDLSRISYNLIHHSGDIYDTIFYLRKHQAKYEELGDYSEAEIANWWFKIGIYYGTTVFLVLYSPMDITPYDPAADYHGLANDDEEDASVDTEEQTDNGAQDQVIDESEMLAF